MNRRSRTILLAAAALLAVPAVLAGTYKWVDENGKVHYSDKPVEGAEEVRLPNLPTYDSPEVSLPDPAGTESEDPADSTFSYGTFSFISPQQEQVFWNIGLKLPVQLRLQPPLRRGDRVKVFLNGELKAGPSQSLGFTLDGVHRGTWTIRAVVEDANGNTVANAGPVKFFVRQTSIKN